MDNLLLEGSYFDSVLKISNFGYSKSAVLDSAMDTKGLSEPAYSSPELLSGHKEAAYDGAAVDVWAAGVVFPPMQIPLLLRQLSWTEAAS